MPQQHPPTRWMGCSLSPSPPHGRRSASRSTALRCRSRPAPRLSSARPPHSSPWSSIPAPPPHPLPDPGPHLRSSPRSTDSDGVSAAAAPAPDPPRPAGKCRRPAGCGGGQRWERWESGPRPPPIGKPRLYYSIIYIIIPSFVSLFLPSSLLLSLLPPRIRLHRFWISLPNQRQAAVSSCSHS